MTVTNGTIPVEALESVKNRETLFAFLHKYLNWPLEQDDTFTYQGPEVPGDTAARVELSRFVPFTADDPFVIMLAEFTTDFRRSDLREILRAIRKEMRTRGAYQGKGLEEIIFLCATRDYQGLRFAHFSESEGRQPKLSVFGCDRESITTTRTLREVNLPALNVPLNESELAYWAEKTRDTWLSAWNVEAVTDRFFSEFHAAFKDIQQHIAAASANISPADLHSFTLTMMNRMLFCWFIQQKRWLAHDPFYLTKMWEQIHIKDTTQDLHADTYYQNCIRPLFLHMLNTPPDKRDPEIANRMGDIPYLNGGLFEENDLDRRADPANEKRDITVTNEAIGLLISQRESDGRPCGLFQRWNFTVQESTPLDIDVAVDPEMLGKVFEELMNELTASTEETSKGDGKRKETKRHSTGAYYTPRPIVSFMCKEAIKGYLGSGEEITRFVDNYDADGLRNPEAILLRLQRVKACDPACGSGAYLLGLLQELIQLRRALFASTKVDALSDYNRKLEIIQHSLYGVDLEPSAVEIARLRLWLSLIVDFDEGGDLSKVPALPNLDFKIEQGDSLSAPDPSIAGSTLFRHTDVNHFSQLKAQYGDPNYKGDKTALLQKINTLRAQIAQNEHAENSVTGFDWRVEFAEVFDESEPDRTMDGRFAFANEVEQQQSFLDPDTMNVVPGGFDIVLANPPYVRHELIIEQKPALKRIYDELYCGTADLYIFFYYRALQLLKNDGMLVFISSNKWLRAGYGEKLRAHIADKARVWSITDFGELPVFQTASTFPMIIIMQKGEGVTNTCFTQVKSLKAPYPEVRELMEQQGSQLPSGAIDKDKWRLVDAETMAILKKMEAAGVPLIEYINGQIFRGVLTGFNKAFVIDSAKRDELIAADANSSEIIKPLVVGDDVRKWRIERQDRWMIFTRRGINIDAYPAVKAHLTHWRRELEPRPSGWDKRRDGEWPGRKPGSYKWHEIQDEIAYYLEFDKPKIVFPEIAREPRFVFDTEGTYTNNKAFIIPLNDLYLLGILNSSLAWLYTKTACAALGDENSGGRVMLQWVNFKRLPIPNASAEEQTSIAALVQKCLDAHGVGCEVWESEINERVARLYGI